VKTVLNPSTIGDSRQTLGIGCHMALKIACNSTGGAYSRHACPEVGLAADSAALMRIMMAASAELISADSILVKTHLYLRE